MNITNPTTNPTTMNTEQQPEPLSVILAEMHAELDCIDDTKVIPVIYIKNRLSRIEAAAERDRAITDIMLAVKDKPLPHPDPEHAPPMFFPMTKTQLQTLSDLVAIAHDEMDGLPHHEQELERFDSLLFDMKARYAFDKPYTAPGDAAAIRAALKAIDENTDLLDIAEGVAPNLHPSHSFVAVQIRKIVRAALAAPARNCDRFQTAEEAYAAWQKLPNLASAFAWLFAPAEGGKE